MESSRRTHTVLVVDDEAGIRESLRLILEPHYRVLTADTGEAALGILERERISVMTLDLRMPGWDGQRRRFGSARSRPLSRSSLSAPTARTARPCARSD
jgi:DNA-binding response OmpR family regulator